MEKDLKSYVQITKDLSKLDDETPVKEIIKNLKR